jgi:hypothetical protein
VTLSGRYLAGAIGAGGVKIGGRFARDTYNITASRPLSPEEAIEIAIRRFGAKGSTDPRIEVERASVTAAWRREEE